MYVRWQVMTNGCFKTESRSLRELEEFYGVLSFIPLYFCSTYQYLPYYIVMCLPVSSEEVKHQEGWDSVFYVPC